MFESVHRVGSRIRHMPGLEGQVWLWRGVEPLWGAIFRAAAHGGFRTRVNDEVFKLEYAHAARYDRSDRHAYEPIVCRALLGPLREGMVVCDVGAHIGLLTLAAAKRVGPRGRVFAFEPTPDALASLRHHVALDGFDDRVEVVDAAVGDVDAQVVSFYVYHDSMSASLGRDNLDGEIHPLQMQNCRSSISELEQSLGEVGYQLDPLDDPGPQGIFHSRITRSNAIQ